MAGPDRPPAFSEEAAEILLRVAKDDDLGTIVTCAAILREPEALLDPFSEALGSFGQRVRLLVAMGYI